MKRIIYTLVALAATASAMAAGQKALTITMKDGSTVSYELDKIDNMRFGRAPLPMGQPTTGPYAPGDYYCDGTVQGIVVTVDKKGNYGTLCSLIDAGEYQWSTWGDYEWVETGANSETDGMKNQQIIAELEPTYEHYPAFGACAAEGEGWYFPAIREVQALSNIRTAVNTTLKSLGYPEIAAESFYWTSSEPADFYYADGNAFGVSMDTPGMFGIPKVSYSKVRAFHTFGEVVPPTYSIGQMYDKDGVKGVIWWVDEDDTYARIISVDETSAAWGEKGKTTGASSANDGEANTAAIRKLSSTFAGYPAFAGCTSPWYLPAQNELANIASNLDAINATLKANGYAEISPSDIFWSSTEATADNAAQVVMSTGTATYGAKDAQRKVRKVAYVGDRPVVAGYSIGDPYYDGDVVIGIVCAVSPDGQHGTYLALQNVVQTGRINALWAQSPYDEIEAGASSVDDGEANMKKFAELDASFSVFPALQVTAALGEGWYIGALNEMTAVYDNITTIDAALKAHGGSTFNNNDYWTSTEIATAPAQRVHTVNPVTGVVDNLITRKYGFNQVRPMKKF